MFKRKKGSKYNATKVEVDGIKFDSRKEAKRYEELRRMELAKEISDLKLQVTYELIPSQKKPSGGTERAIKYIADFVYQKDGNLICEDVKGFKLSTAYNVFSIKRKLMLQIYGIEIVEV